MSILKIGQLFSLHQVQCKQLAGTNIGLGRIKNRRLTIPLAAYPTLTVGQCVPFYFCPRSVMLYVIYRGNNPELSYQNGQENIIHLTANLKKAVEWANSQNKKWVFTDGNASSAYSKEYNRLEDLNKINWEAVYSLDWRECKDKKQAEFLVEQDFPFSLFEEIGVKSSQVQRQVQNLLKSNHYNIPVNVRPEWYY